MFPASINGDLMKLVHFTNGFKLVNNTKPLKAGNICRAEAKIVSIVNDHTGKTVNVKGHVYSEGVPVVEVVSSFMYRGRFTDNENTFKTAKEPDYLVEIANDATVSVIQSSSIAGRSLNSWSTITNS
jgi:hypothetical protein